MENLLAEYILYEPSNLTRDFVNSILTVKKGDICTYITHFYCIHALTPNAWVLQQLKSYFHYIDRCKPADKDTLASLCYGLFHLLASTEKKQYVFHNESERSDLFKTHITNLIHSTANGDNKDLVHLKDVLNAEVYSLLNIMYDGFLYSVQSSKILQMCFVIIRYLITLQPRQYYAQDKKLAMDIYDILFLVCISYSQNMHCPKEVGEYIMLTKDLFYYQVKKRDKVKRVNLLFYLVHVIVNKHVVAQAIDYDGVRYIERLMAADANPRVTPESSQEREDPPSKSSDSTGSKSKKVVVNEDAKLDAVKEKCQYLFVYTDVDEQTGYQIQMERERNQMMAKLMRTSTKEINVDYLLAKDPSEFVNVAKLGPKH